MTDFKSEMRDVIMAYRTNVLNCGYQERSSSPCRCVEDRYKVLSSLLALISKRMPKEKKCYSKSFKGETCRQLGHQLCCECYRNEAISEIRKEMGI